MKAAPTMARIITQLAEKHDLHLHEPRAYMRLTMPHYDPLAIEVLAPNLVHVAHIYTLPNGETQADPGILFFTGYGPWLPVEIRQRIGGYRIYAALSPALDDVESVQFARQADLAAFAEMWAANLVGQGWLADGVLTESSTTQRTGEAPNVPGKRVSDDAMASDGFLLWPVPIVEEPDDEQIEAWLIDDVCEATDGCLVEPDGTCPHGYPSWLRHLGLM